MLTRCGGQLRTSMAGVTGLDLGAALAVGRALGYDERALVELLPFGEAGAVAALSKQQDGN